MKRRSFFSKLFGSNHAGLDIADQAIRYVVLDEGSGGYEVSIHGTIKLPVGVIVSGAIEDPRRLARILGDLRKDRGIDRVRTSLPESHAFVLEQAGIKSVGTELRAHALARALVAKAHPHASLIVNFGEHQTDLAVVYDGVVYLTRSLQLPNNPTERLMQTFGISQHDAEMQKTTVGLSRRPEDEAVFAVLAEDVFQLVHEIRGIFAEWHTSETKQPRIHDIILVGSNAHINGLSEYLATALHTEVHLGNPWVHLNDLETYVPPLRKEEAHAYATAFGLAMGE